MSKKHYVVWKGSKTGVFDSWSEVKLHTQGQNDAQYMGFPSKQEAETAFASTYTKALMQRSLEKSGGSKSSSSAPAKSAQYAKTKPHFSEPDASADIQIYCDGACSPNPGKSGTGMAIYHKKVLSELWFGLYEPHGTNNTAELNGILEAFKYAKPYLDKQQNVQILSDSKYSIDCITKWAKGWQAKGWTRGKNEEIKNLDIIKPCFNFYQQYKSQLIITHVKGHANIEGNELSDRMAVLARSSKEANFIAYTKTLDIPTLLAMTGD